MSRIRWHHFYLALALFDVMVIFVSLSLQRHTEATQGNLRASVEDLDAKTKWIRKVQERVLNLSEPLHEMFETKNPAAARQRHERAQIMMDEVLKAGAQEEIEVDKLNEHVQSINKVAAAVLKEYSASLRPGLSAEDGRQRMVRSAELLAEMNQHEIQTIRDIDLLFAKKTEDHWKLLHQYEADLVSRGKYERYFIAGVIVILVGVMYFGRKFQEAHVALEAERKRLEEERRERLASIGELCSSVAHGIRNPLAGIRSSAELTLELGNIDADSRDRVRDIMSEIRRLSDRVTDLLNFARAGGGVFEVNELQGLLGSAVDELRPEMDRLGIRVERDFAKEELMVECDRHQLQQIVIELISNAMEQSKRDDTIWVSARKGKKPGTVEFAVRDQGEGVPPERRGRIFELFFTSKPRGTGIGLATVRRVARQHGGEVALECPAEGGACFVVTLPVAGARAVKQFAQQQRAAV